MPPCSLHCTHSGFCHRCEILPCLPACDHCHGCWQKTRDSWARDKGLYYSWQKQLSELHVSTRSMSPKSTEPRWTTAHAAAASQERNTALADPTAFTVSKAALRQGSAFLAYPASHAEALRANSRWPFPKAPWLAL